MARRDKARSRSQEEERQVSKGENLEVAMRVVLVAVLAGAFVLLSLLGLRQVEAAQQVIPQQETLAQSLQTTFAFTRSTATITTTVRAIDHSIFGFTSAELARTSQAVISVRTGDLSYASGSADNPAALDGQLVTAGNSVTISGNRDILGLRFIRDTATDTVVSISLYRYPGD